MHTRVPDRLQRAGHGKALHSSAGFQGDLELMDGQMLKSFDAALTEVMTRFRKFFTDHMDQDHVPFRQRPEFAAPLVTVMGYTYGVRIPTDAEGPRLAVEVSANVYDDEFDLKRFKSKLEETHAPSLVKRTIENFMSREEAQFIEKEGVTAFVSLFSYDLERDVGLIEKEKQTASKVTGRFVDTILTIKYWMDPARTEWLAQHPKFFVSAVYLYCLRTFIRAYHESLSP